MEKHPHFFVRMIFNNRCINGFRSIPFQLGKENKKFQITFIHQEARFKDYRGSLEWLEDSGIINISRVLQMPHLPQKGNVKDDSCVIYSADNGLLLSQLNDGAEMDFRRNKNFDVYKSSLFESIVFESLIKSGYEIHYYKKENSTLQEDFFVKYKDYLVPIEVKSSNNNSKSLLTLINSSSYPEIKFGIKIIKGNIGSSNNIYSFSYFCTFFIKEFF